MFIQLSEDMKIQKFNHKTCLQKKLLFTQRTMYSTEKISMIKKVRLQQETKNSGKKATFPVNSQERKTLILMTELSSHAAFAMKQVNLFRNFLEKHIGECVQLQNF